MDFRFPALVALGYLSGAVPTGYLVVKRLKGYDIRTRGSGNPGTANVYRNAGAFAGAVTLFVDALKGYLPVCLARCVFPGGDAAAIAVGAAAVVGHNWTIFLGFRGGKGVATSGGVFLALLPGPMAVAMAAFAAAVFVSGHISVGSMVGATVLPAAAAAFGAPGADVAAAVASAALIVYKHIPNIRRLRQNRELGIHGPSA